MSDYFPLATRPYFDLFAHYIANYILSNTEYMKLVKNTYFDFTKMKNNSITITKDDKKKNVEFHLIGRYINSKSVFEWTKDKNTYFRNLIYDTYSDFFNHKNIKNLFDLFFGDVIKIEKELAICIPGLLVLFFTDYVMHYVVDGDYTYYFIAKINFKYKFTTEEILLKLREIHNKLFLLRPRVKRTSKKVNKKKTNKKIKA